MRLSVLEQDTADGRLQSVTVGLEFRPGESDALPTMADIHLRVNGPTMLTRVGLGEAALEAEKELVADPRTGLPYQTLGDEVHRFVLMSTQNTSRLGAGRWLLFEFLVGDTETEGPIQIGLVEREQTLAPTRADALLWNAGIDAPIVIWPEVNHAE